ncbi:MAG: hypothetical protein KGL67_02315 [Patescibacteria group bacterium]|nr:hypothetical protein [Patescibacteria group bacterium]
MMENYNLENNSKPDLSLGNLHFTDKEKADKVKKLMTEQGMSEELATNRVNDLEKMAQNQRAEAILKKEMGGGTTNH